MRGLGGEQVQNVYLSEAKGPLFDINEHKKKLMGRQKSIKILS